MAVTPRPPASERLDRNELISTALAIVDREGLEALTLRKVGAAWNVSPMALYWHFKDKEALLDALVERMLAELELGSDPAPDLKSVLEAVLGVLRAHPALAAIAPVRMLRTDAGLDLGELVLGLLRAQGHSPVAAAQLSVFLLDGLIGLVVRQPGELAVADPVVREALQTAKRVRLRALSPDTHPHLSEAAEFLLGLPDEEEYFARGINLLLNGVKQL